MGMGIGSNGKERASLVPSITTKTVEVSTALAQIEGLVTRLRTGCLYGSPRVHANVASAAGPLVFRVQQGAVGAGPAGPAAAGPMFSHPTRAENAACS